MGQFVHCQDEGMYAKNEYIALFCPVSITILCIFYSLGSSSDYFSFYYFYTIWYYIELQIVNVVFWSIFIFIQKEEGTDIFMSLNLS